MYLVVYAGVTVYQNDGSWFMLGSIVADYFCFSLLLGHAFLFSMVGDLSLIHI